MTDVEEIEGMYYMLEVMALREEILKIYDFKFKCVDPETLVYKNNNPKVKALILYSEWINKREIIQETNNKENLIDILEFLKTYTPSIPYEKRMNIIGNSKQKIVYSTEKIEQVLSKFTKDSHKHKKKDKLKVENSYFRYDLSPKDNRIFKTEIEYLLEILENDIIDNDDNTESINKVLTIKNILKNVKHIKVSNEKTNATKNANKSKIDKSREKIQSAYEALKQENKKITIYSIRKEAKVAHATAEKHKDIFEDDLI